jgi:hypothetical protein
MGNHGARRHRRIPATDRLEDPFVLGHEELRAPGIPGDEADAYDGLEHGPPPRTGPEGDTRLPVRQRSA